jgi:hypothetical protein
MNILEDKLSEKDINNEAVVLEKNIGKTAVALRIDPFSFIEKIHKRPHWMTIITIIGIGKKPNCYLVKSAKKTYELHATHVIRIQNQLVLYDITGNN